MQTNLAQLIIQHLESSSIQQQLTKKHLETQIVAGNSHFTVKTGTLNYSMCVSLCISFPLCVCVISYLYLKSRALCYVNCSCRLQCFYHSYLYLCLQMTEPYGPHQY